MSTELLCRGILFHSTDSPPSLSPSTIIFPSSFTAISPLPSTHLQFHSRIISPTVSHPSLYYSLLHCHIISSIISPLPLLLFPPLPYHLPNRLSLRPLLLSPPFPYHLPNHISPPPLLSYHFLNNLSSFYYIPNPYQSPLLHTATSTVPHAITLLYYPLPYYLPLVIHLPPISSLEYPLLLLTHAPSSPPPASPIPHRHISPPIHPCFLGSL